MRITGSELWILAEADYDMYEPWISVVINGVRISRQMVQKGKNWICLFRGMDPQKEKTVEIIKDVQAMSDDNRHMLAVWSVRTDGSLLPVAPRKRKLEFIGDSITSGEGAIGSREETEWISMWFSALDNYTYMTAKALDAEYHVISQSGWGVLTSWDNNPEKNVPDCYCEVCGVQKNRKDNLYGADRKWDFSRWKPDAVIINLGTNDESAFHNPAYTDPATGITYKQRLLEDGSFHPEDLKKFEDKAVCFLELLRSCNPKAKLVWAYGMLGTDMEPALKRAINTYRRKSKDEDVSYLRLPAADEESIGARSHPGRLAHERAAEVLACYLNTLL